MKKLLILSILNISFFSSTFSKEAVRRNYDSLWYFHPFNIDILLGTWTPIHHLSNHYDTGIQFGAGFGIMSSNKTRICFLLMPRTMNPKNPISLRTKDSIIQYQDNRSGISIGGWFTYNFFKNKIQSSEVIIGLTREIITTNILNEDNKDSIDIAGLGLSCGINTWFNTFNKLNFGLRAVYTYSTYDNSKYLAKPIGGHSIAFSLVYRFANRDPKNKKWY